MAINPLVEYVVEEWVREENAVQENHFQISFDKLRVNIFSGDLRLVNFSFQPDEMTVEEWAQLMNSVPRATELHVSELKLKNVNLSELIFGEKLLMDTLVFDSPEINVLLMNGESDSSARISFTDYFSEITLNAVSIRDAEISVIDMDDTSSVFSLGNFSTELTNVYVDSALLEEGRFFSYSNLEYTFEDLKFFVNDDQQVSLKKLQVNAQKEQILFEGIEIAFLGDKFEWNAQQEYRKSLVTSTVSEIELIGFDFVKYELSNSISAEKVVLRDPKLNVFVDDYSPRRPNWKPFFPIEKLNKLDIPLDVEELIVENGKIEIELLSEGNDYTGLLSFIGLEAKITDVSNRADKSGSMLIDATALLMGEGKLQAHMDLKRNGKGMDINGRLGNMSLTAFNKIFEPALNTSISSGELGFLNFHFLSDYAHSTGMVAMDYNELHINLYKEKGSVELDKGRNRMLGFLVNTFIKQHNDFGTRKFQYGRIDYDRPVTTGFFGTLWKSVATGMGETVSGMGLKTRKAQKLMKEEGIILNPH